MAAGSESTTGYEVIGAAFGATQSSLAELVGHGVGEGLDGVTAGDDIAVQVDQGVELVEAESAVPPEQGQACRAERTAAEAVKARGRRRQRWLVVSRWAATVTPLDARPEPVADLAELVEDLSATLGQHGELVVQLRELGEQVFAVRVEAKAYFTVEPSCVTHRELTVRTVRSRGERHRCGPFRFED